MRNTILYIIFLQLGFLSLYAQDLKFEQLTIDQGLSQNSVKCIYQDSKGYLWFGTEDGLNRYDGYTFKIYKSLQDDTTSLSDNIINSIFEDSKGNLWVGTFNGLNKFNRNTDGFKRYLSSINLSHLKAKQDYYVGIIYEDKQNRLWVIYQYNIFKYIPESDSFERVDIKLDDPLLYVNFLYEDKDQRFWIGTDKGLYEYNRKTGVYTNYLPRPYDNDSTANSIYSIAEDTGSIFWIGSGWGLYRFDKNTGKFLDNYPMNLKIRKDFEIPAIISDSLHLWFSWHSWENSTTGVSVFDKKTEIYTEVYKSPFVSRFVCTNLFEDKCGDIWVGSFLGGIIKFEKNKKFSPSMNGNTVSAFLEDEDNNLWIATVQKGLFKINPKNNEIINYQQNNNVENQLGDNFISCIYQDSKGEIWIGTFRGGLYRVIKSKNESTTVGFERVMPGVIRSIMEDAKQRLWIGLEGNWVLLDPKTRKTISFQNDVEHPNSISNIVESTALDPQSGDIWIATWNGLYRMVLPKNEEVTRTNVNFIPIKHDIVNKNTISDNRVISLCIDKKGTLWVGSSASGFNKIEYSRSDPPEKTAYKITRYSEKEGLPNNQVYGIIEDNEGNLWLSTNKGLSKFNPIDETFVNFDKSDGLQSNEFFWRSYYKSPSGKMYFGGLKGYNSFYPNDIKLNQYIPPVHITGFSIFNKLQVLGNPGSPLTKQIDETREINIHYDQSIISFDYVALNYSTSQNNRYAYKLEGFDKEWQQVGHQRRATYTNLDPGTYKFCVKASNNDGIWNEQGTTLTLIIKPPFWKTVWFRILVFVVIIIVLIGTYYIRVSAIRKKNRMLELMVEERTLEVNKKNEALLEDAEILNATNTLLEERQQQIEEQSEELTVQRDKLSELNTTKDKLFSILAHDLKSPFNIILGFSDLLLKNIDSYEKEKIKLHVTYISDASRNTYDLLSNLLQWTQAQRGMIKFEPELFKVSDSLEHELVMLRHQALRKNIKIVVSIKGNEVLVNADLIMLTTVMRNLISNAIKFSFTNSEVTLVLEFLTDEFIFSVYDKGKGMTNEEKRKLFKVSEHITTLGTSGEKGTGLGLILCADFIERHKGKIWAESQTNEGSNFHFKIPLHTGILNIF